MARLQELIANALRFRLSRKRLALIGMGAVFAVWVGWSVIRNMARRRAIEVLAESGVQVARDYDPWIWSFELPLRKPALSLQPASSFMRQRITDDVLSHVEDVATLRRADLADLQVTDVGLGHFKNLKHLESLDLSNTRVTDVGLRYLQGVGNLETLLLTDTAVTGEGFEELSGLKRLKTLYLERTPFADQALLHLGRLTSLESLYLDDTPVSDRGLAHLGELKSLFWLSLVGTNVTEQGLFALQQALPETTINVGTGPHSEIENVSFDGIYVELGPQAESPKAPADPLSAEEYAVLNAVLSGDFQGRTNASNVVFLAIGGTTLSTKDIFESGWEDRWILAERRRSSLPKLGRDLILSWERNNLRRHPLGNALKPTPPHRVYPLSQSAESKGVIYLGDFPGAFATATPGVLVSRPGFSSDATEALVYLEVYFPGAHGSTGVLVLAEKSEEKWRIRTAAGI